MTFVLLQYNWVINFEIKLFLELGRIFACSLSSLVSGGGFQQQSFDFDNWLIFC